MWIRKVKLNYKPVAKRKQTGIAYSVSSEHVIAINKSIQQKTLRNRLESGMK